AHPTWYERIHTTFQLLLKEIEGLEEFKLNNNEGDSGSVSTEAGVMVTDNATASATENQVITGFKNREDPIKSRKRKKQLIEEAIEKKRRELKAQQERERRGEL
ncbi:hypothetical protein LINGRAHAP2_LOCUS2428, partial [Linum grandiflorum]